MKGTGAVGGMAIAGAYFLIDDSAVIVKKPIIDTEKEYARFLIAKSTAASQLEQIIKTASRDLGKENGDILDFQLLLLEDKDFLAKIKEIISAESVNSEYALESAARHYMGIFSSMGDEYLRERAQDIADLAKRLACILSGHEPVGFQDIRDDVILVARDLTPSQTIGINKNRVKGICLERGGMSSHSVIIARSLGIPCIIGVPGLLQGLVQGEAVMMDGDTGEITVSPTDEQKALYRAYRIRSEEDKKELERFKYCVSRTRDGHEVRILANITTSGETKNMLESGGEGVGLFRTEFLYMAGNTPPSEALQYKVYSEIAGALGGRPLVIRTLDAGGDKNISYLGITPEDNPFLGFRAIRYCLENTGIFKTQISAILRAGLKGNVQLMLPMVSSLSELRRAKQLIRETGEELKAGGIPYFENMRIGIMVETPAAAAMADKLAGESDFFSIGTNDLTQYLFAADRMNPKVAYLNSYYHPALLRTVYHICKCAALKGIEVDICGQAGEIPALVPIWAAMGVNCLSVSIPSIPNVRRLICGTTKADAFKTMEKLLSLDTAEEAEEHLRQNPSCKE